MPVHDPSPSSPLRRAAGAAAALTLGVMGALVLTVAPSGAEDPPPPCADPAARQLDFWIGEWNLTWDLGGPGKGTNVITSEFGGCVIQERFSAPDMPFHGMSVSVYDPTAKVWRQTWVDDSGAYLDFVGGMEDGLMRLSRSTVRGGQPIEQRMTFYNVTEDSLDWDWEISKDGGTTWELRWRIHYERKR